ncbi:MAG: methyltransferase, TIGR04325 family [Betaproteobacteria bacterium]|nr:methyltransferase, TIGR04325 family [Betaproteobacteria bacterium]
MSRDNLIERLKRFPPIHALRKARFERYAQSPEGRGLCWGAFPTFEEAKRAIPADTRLGYDNDQCAQMYADRLEQIFPYDYPVLFWLRSALTPGSSVFDIGGHVGLHYHSYRRYLPELETVSWTVCEVPAVVERGRKLAIERSAPTLAFTSDFSSIDGKEIVLSAGALQYLEQTTITELIASVSRPPQHVILNKIPLHDGPDFVTVENTGPSQSPYRNFNRAKFIDEFRRLGYEHVDSWDVPGRLHHMPYHPELSYEHSSGVYFARKT